MFGWVPFSGGEKLCATRVKVKLNIGYVHITKAVIL